MQIICPSCQTKFVTDAKEISDQGRRVRCSQCQYMWWHHIQDYGIIRTQPIAAAIPQYTSNKKWSARKYIYAMPLVILALSYVMTLQYYKKPAPVIDAILAPDIKIEQVNAEYTLESTVVHCTMINQDAKAQSLLPLAVELFDSQGNILKRHEIDETLTIEPGKSVAFKVIFYNKGYIADKIAIYVGSRLEYLMNQQP